MAFDFKKEYKEFYLPKNRPEIVRGPKANYIAVRGAGDPNEEGGAYQQAIGILYAVAYTLKMSRKTDHQMEGFFDYVVPPPAEAASFSRSSSLMDRKSPPPFPAEKVAGLFSWGSAVHQGRPPGPTYSTRTPFLTGGSRMDWFFQ